MDFKTFTHLSTAERKKAFFNLANKVNLVEDGYYNSTGEPTGDKENNALFRRIRDYLEHPLSERVPKKWMKDFD